MLGKRWVQTSLQMHTFIPCPQVSKILYFSMNLSASFSLPAQTLLKHVSHWNIFCRSFSETNGSWEEDSVTFAPQQGTSRTTPTSQSPPFHLMRGNRGHRLERKIAEAGLGLPGPLQVDTGLILGGTKNPMCLSRLKEKVGSTWKITTHRGDSTDPEKLKST